MLTPMNIAIIGGVLVLLLLMVKMRKDRAAAAKPASAQKERRRSRRAERVKEPKIKEAKVKEPKGRRGRRGPASIEAATSEVAATTAPPAPPAQEVAFTEPTPDDAAWVDGIDDASPVAEQATDPFVSPPVDAAAAVPAWTDEEVVSAPGWPTPGEMDGGWAIGGDSAQIVSSEAEWTPEPVFTEPAEDEVAAEETVAGAEPEAVEIDEFPVLAESSWDEESFDPAAGWGDDAEEAAPVAAASASTPEAVDADVDWATEWSDDAPAAVTETPAPDAVEESAAPAADEADDTWVVAGWDDEPAGTPVVEAVSEAPVVESLADWASDGADDWSAPAGEVTAEGPADDASEWDIATEEAVAAVALEAPVFEAEAAPTFDENPYADDAYEVFDDMPGPAPEGRSLDALVGFTFEEPAPVEVEVEVEAPVEVPAEPVDTFEVEYEAPAEPAGRSQDPRTEQPLDQWASLAPATVAAPAVADDPAARWSTIAPIAPKVPVPADPAARWAAITPIAPAAGAPQRDRHDEDLSGRFALGGFAVDEGHQVVTGVTFRFAADEAPARWVFGPDPDAAPGTLVIDVEGVLNCTAADVEVLDDPGFAPTTNGFTLRLTAPAGGPFAASGTYRVV